MLHKIFHNVDHFLYCKILRFVKEIHSTRFTAQQNDKAFVLARYNTYQFSRCFTCFITHVWNNLSNEKVLAVKKDRFYKIVLPIALTEILCVIITIINTRLFFFVIY